MAPGGGKAGWGTGSSSGTACKIHTEGALEGGGNMRNRGEKTRALIRCRSGRIERF